VSCYATANLESETDQYSGKVVIQARIVTAEIVSNGWAFIDQLDAVNVIA
jgi:hypothetical protein